MSNERGPSILVVDDDALVRQLVATGLEAIEQAKIFVVEDGIKAQNVLMTEEIDVVVTDVLMPNMDGRELMKWAQEHNPEPLWIVLSGLDTFDAAVDALHLGAFEFLAKPPQIKHLTVGVQRALDHLALQRDRERLYHELERSNAELADKVRQLENACHILEDQADLIHADLERAEAIQRALLPQVPPKIGRWCVETLYRPGSNVGGDYFDVVAIGDHHLGVVIADAAGHGVAAAMLSVLFKLRLNLTDDQGEPLNPSEVLSNVNEVLHGDIDAPGSFITASYALLDRRSGHLRFASAGHPPGIRTRANGQSEQLPRTGPALGLEAHAKYAEKRLDLEAGDRLFLYTDGLVDGGPDAPNQTEIAAELSKDIESKSALLHRFFEDARRDKSDSDDITMILVERSEGTSRFDASGDKVARVPSLPVGSDVQLRQGATKKHGFLSIAGNATWMRSAVFFTAAKRLLKKHDRLTIDLGACEYLDSTFLGTLYEIATMSPHVNLQRVPPKIRALFEELDMHSVLERISVLVDELPAEMPVLDRTEVGEDEAEPGQRILKAHELLASLSEHNEKEFRGVVESLRSDLASTGD